MNKDNVIMVSSIVCVCLFLVVGLWLLFMWISYLDNNHVPDGLERADNFCLDRGYEGVKVLDALYCFNSTGNTCLQKNNVSFYGILISAPISCYNLTLHEVCTWGNQNTFVFCDDPLDLMKKVTS